MDIKITFDKVSAKRNGVVRQLPNLLALIMEQIRQLRTIGINNNVYLTVSFTASNQYWGKITKNYVQSFRNHNYVGTMVLPKTTINNAKELSETTMHELLHLVSNDGGHGGEWETYAKQMRTKYGYRLN